MPTTNTSTSTLAGTDLRGTVTLVRYWVARHRAWSLAIVLLAAVTLTAALRLLAAGPDDEPPVTPTAAAPAAEVRSDAATDPNSPSDQPLMRTTDPDVFTQAVAEALFTWDTTTSSLPDLSERLLVVADPTGGETPGLLVDLRTYLPSDPAWRHLAQYKTRQWIELTSVIEPDAWAGALATAPEDAVAPGTTARTVTGVRHRAGTWDGAPTTTRSPVQFTMFLVCAPTYEQCHLLRLSTPGLALR